VKHNENHKFIFRTITKPRRHLIAAAGFCATITLTLAGISAPSATAADQPTSVAVIRPDEGTHLLLLKPEIRLDLLTTSGMHEPRAEWSKSAQDNLTASLTRAITTRKLVVDTVAIETYDAPRALQIIKLNEAVSASIQKNRSFLSRLPTKTGFDWTLGEGAATLLPASHEDASTPKYALFINGKGTFSSNGRTAIVAGMALLGAAMPMGGQQLRASVIDLQTGQVVWAEFQAVPFGVDIRTPEGADKAVERLLKALPF
jgi:hypothetical protein